MQHTPHLAPPRIDHRMRRSRDVAIGHQMREHERDLRGVRDAARAAHERAFAVEDGVGFDYLDA